MYLFILQPTVDYASFLSPSHDQPSFPMLLILTLLNISHYLYFSCPSYGTLNGAPCHHWHAKNRFNGFGSLGPPGKFQNFSTDNCLLIAPPLNA